MGSYAIVTTARQDERLTQLLRERNEALAREGKPQIPSIEAMLRLEFADRFRDAEARLSQMDRARIADAFDSADMATRAAVKATLGIA
jgi:hypothetical protein